MGEPYNYLGLMGGQDAFRIAPAVQDAIFGQQQQQQNANLLAEQQRQNEARKAMATLVTTPNLAPDQVNQLMAPIAQADPKAAQAYMQQRAMQNDLPSLLSDPNPQAISSFMLKFPDATKGMKDAWELMQKGQAEAAFRTASDVFGYLHAGDVKGAKDILLKHRDAERAAGLDTSEYDHLVELLDTDPKQAQALAGMMVASRAGADQFSATYKAINPTEAISPTQKEYDWRVSQFGKESADQWLSTQDTKLVPVQQGGSVYAYGPTGSGQPSAAPLASAGGSDSVLTFDQYKAYADVQGNDKAAAWARGNGLTVQVSTPAQANMLAPGTRYRTPDGKVFVR